MPDPRVDAGPVEDIMRIIGLPADSFLTLIVIPAVIVAYQFYYCWQVYTGRRD